MSYYAVAKGKNVGIFLSFDNCNKAVKGFKNPIMKKFKTLKECEEFIIKNKNSKNILKEEYRSFDIKFDDNIINEIYDALLTYQVIFFRDQKFEPSSQKAFAERIGKPIVYPFVKSLEDFPEITPILKK